MVDFNYVKSVNEDKRNELREIFQFYDEDGDGLIQAKEIETLIKIFNLPSVDKSIQQLINPFDLDKDGSLNFEEFQDFIVEYTKIKDSHSELTKTFQLIDSDRDGYITALDLKEFMNTLGEKLTDEEAREMIREAKDNTSGKLDFSSFEFIMNQF